jgi:hypothetical protein
MAAEDEVMAELLRAARVMRRILMLLYDRLEQSRNRRAQPVRLPDGVVRDEWGPSDRERWETLRDARQHNQETDAALDGLGGPDLARTYAAEERAVREHGNTPRAGEPTGIEAEPRPSTLAERPSRIEAALNPDANRDWMRNGVVPTPDELRQALTPDVQSGRHHAQADTGRHHLQEDTGHHVPYEGRHRTDAAHGFVPPAGTAAAGAPEQAGDADQLRALRDFTQAGQPGAHEATRPTADLPNGQAAQTTDQTGRRGPHGPQRDGGGHER